MKKDWVGDNNSVYKIIGASNHSTDDREENDFYATAPLATKLLVQLEKFSPNIWEPACGLNHITNILRENGYHVRTSDLIDRLNDGTIEQIDFLASNEQFNGDIVTNPPYKYAQDFVEKAMETVTTGHKVVMFLKLTFLETVKRRKLFDKYPPKVIYVSSSRLGCAKNGEFGDNDNIGSAVCYCWYVWEKGYIGDTKIKWFN